MIKIMTYQTIQGDTFDNISKKVYGNEKMLQKLIDANPEQLGTVIFPAGVLLEVPEQVAEEQEAYSPAPWRR